MEIGEDSLVTKGKTSEGKINTTEIEEINEIKDYLFIKLKPGMSFIISKVKTDADELEKIKDDLKMLVDKKGIKHNVELDWKMEMINKTLQHSSYNTNRTNPIRDCLI